MGREPARRPPGGRLAVDGAVHRRQLRRVAVRPPHVHDLGCALEGSRVTEQLLQPDAVQLVDAAEHAHDGDVVRARQLPGEDVVVPYLVRATVGDLNVDYEVLPGAVDEMLRLGFSTKYCRALCRR